MTYSLFYFFIFYISPFRQDQFYNFIILITKKNIKSKKNKIKIIFEFLNYFIYGKNKKIEK